MKPTVPTKQATVSLIKGKSRNVLSCILQLRIGSYLTSVLRYTVLIFGYLSFGRRPQWTRGLRSGFVAARLLGLRIRIPPETWKSVSCDCCVLTGTRLCVGLITIPMQSYRLWCV